MIATCTRCERQSEASLFAGTVCGACSIETAMNAKLSVVYAKHPRAASLRYTHWAWCRMLETLATYGDSPVEDSGLRAMLRKVKEEKTLAISLDLWPDVW